MPVKIFAAPGDHRNDFQPLEEQVNCWIEEVHPRIISLHTNVNELSGKRELGSFMLTLLAHYEGGGQ